MGQLFRFDRALVYALLIFGGIVAVALVDKALIGGIAIIVAIVGGYFLPSLIAAARKVPNQGSVFVINLFLGWTLIGWVVALAMAARSVPPLAIDAPRAELEQHGGKTYRRLY